VVVIHDVDLERTTSGRGDVRQLTLAEVRAVSAGYPDRFGGDWAGERVPTLAETLALLRDRARAMIELKAESVTEDETGGLEARAVAEIRRSGMADKVALISFDQRAILRLRQLAPEISRGRIFGRTSADEVLADARATASEVVLPHKSQLSDDLVSRVHAAGIALATWVVDEPEELRELARFDLYAVGSNRPGVLLEAIADGLLD
jgi:glycerophosphoryl diester phosphodiesterase